MAFYGWLKGSSSEASIEHKVNVFLTQMETSIYPSDKVKAGDDLLVSCARHARSCAVRLSVALPSAGDNQDRPDHGIRRGDEPPAGAAKR